MAEVLVFPQPASQFLGAGGEWGWAVMPLQPHF